MSTTKQLTRLLTVAVLIGVTSTTDGITAGDKKNTAVIPSPRMEKGDANPDAKWAKRHDGFVVIAKKNENPILFLGDSITDGWRNQPAWKKTFEPLKAANFGIGGDRTQHVLWRLQNGELDGYTPKLVVLMIGTNNVGSNTADEIAVGIKTIVKTIQEKSKDTKVLLLAVFPRGKQGDKAIRDKLASINQSIAKLDDGGKTVKFMDIGSKLADAEGVPLDEAFQPDHVHLNAKGYEIWAEAVGPTVLTMAGLDKK